MNGYWISFTDGTAGYCEGNGPRDAGVIAEQLTGKIIAKAEPEDEGDRCCHNGLKIATLPYPATPIIWQFEHPVHGKCPPFCYRPGECKGRTACPRNPSCDD